MIEQRRALLGVAFGGPFVRGIGRKPELSPEFEVAVVEREGPGAELESLTVTTQRNQCPATTQIHEIGIVEGVVADTDFGHDVPAMVGSARDWAARGGGGCDGAIVERPIRDEVGTLELPKMEIAHRAIQLVTESALKGRVLRAHR